MADTIRCPHCQGEFELPDAVARLLHDATEKARDGVAIELKSLGNQLDETRTKLREARETELLLRKERLDLEDQRRDLELTVQRTLDAERTQMQERIRRDADEEYRLKEADKEKLIGDMRLQIDELKRKSTPIPAQTIGEVMEQDLEQMLRTCFPQDRFEPVPTGQHGGDLIHHVRDDAGHECGSLLWEVKRTKCWQNAWLGKLREDQRFAKSRLAVLLSQELPRDLADFGCLDGIYVTRRACAPGLAAVLRLALVEIARAERSVENRHGKAEQLLAYLGGNDFRLRFGGLVEALAAMQDDLDKEKRTIEKLWAKRLKQLQLAMSNATGFHGELAGIMGGGLAIEEAA